MHNNNKLKKPFLYLEPMANINHGRIWYSIRIYHLEAFLRGNVYCNYNLCLIIFNLINTIWLFVKTCRSIIEDFEPGTVRACTAANIYVPGRYKSSLCWTCKQRLERIHQTGGVENRKEILYFKLNLKWFSFKELPWL